MRRYEEVAAGSTTFEEVGRGTTALEEIRGGRSTRQEDARAAMRRQVESAKRKTGVAGTRRTTVWQAVR